jgi:hypothetical protein
MIFLPNQKVAPIPVYKINKIATYLNKVVIYGEMRVR